MISVVRTIRPDGADEAQHHEGGGAHLQAEGVAAAEVGLRHLVGLLLLVLPQPDAPGDEVVKREAIDRVLEGGVEALPVVPGPHPVVNGDEKGKDDLVCHQLPQGNLFIHRDPLLLCDIFRTQCEKYITLQSHCQEEM